MYLCVEHVGPEANLSGLPRLGVAGAADAEDDDELGRSSSVHHPVPSVAGLATIIREHGRPEASRTVQDHRNSHRHGRPPLSAPGWYPDPSGAPGQRYWNGTDWTEVPPPPAQQAASKEKNIPGLIALVLGIIGFIFACIPGALIIGWILLPIAFILGIVGLLLSGKAKGTSIAAIITSVIGVVVGVTVFLVVVQDAFEDAFNESNSSPSSESDLSSPPSDNATDPGGESDQGSAGSRENPLPMGEAVSSNDWEITLGTPYEAGAEIAAENPFNSPPEPGMEYWIVPVTATYTGDDTGTPWVDVKVDFVGSDNRTYNGFDCTVVIPDSLNDVGALYRDGVADGNRCVTVPAGADGLWSVSTGFVGEPVFFDAK